MTTLLQQWRRLTSTTSRWRTDAAAPQPQPQPQPQRTASPDATPIPATFDAVLKELAAMNHELAMCAGGAPSAED